MENTNKKSIVSFLVRSKVVAGITAVLLIVVLAYLNDMTKDPTFLCFKSKDQCIIDYVIKLRVQRDDTYNATIAQANSGKAEMNKIIEANKSQLSSGFVNEELKAGRRENVPSSLLQQLTNAIAPKAEAKDNGMADISLSSEPAYSPVLPANSISEFLKSKGSPYAYINFPALAERNGLTMDQMTLLLAISGKESSFGTSYRKKDGPGYRFDNENGLKLHNPVGIKWCLHVDGCPANNTIPDENGFYLQHYDSWEQFWDTYTRQMKLVYFDGQCDSSNCMKNKYVGGNKAWKDDWQYAVDSFTREMHTFGQKYYQDKIAQHNI